MIVRFSIARNLRLAFPVVEKFSKSGSQKRLDSEETPLKKLAWSGNFLSIIIRWTEEFQENANDQEEIAVDSRNRPFLDDYLSAPLVISIHSTGSTWKELPVLDWTDLAPIR
jgi:hypothetical protein